MIYPESADVTVNNITTPPPSPTGKAIKSPYRGYSTRNANLSLTIIYGV
jgi:hypothetical protein